MRIYLVGYMGSGKSFLGSRLAYLLGYSFIDTDAVIESEQGAAVAAIFKQSGEPAFRALEQEVLRHTFSMDKVVIATGGGLPCQGNAMEQMNTKGLTVYLRVRPATVLQRIASDTENRPLLRGIGSGELTGFVSSHMAVRDEVYQQAMLTVDADELNGEMLLEKVIAFSGQSR